MRPLLFVNWARVSARFTALMWALVFVLACLVFLHLTGAGGAASAPAHAVAHPPISSR
jgi:hypothetical protein